QPPATRRQGAAGRGSLPACSSLDRIAAIVECVPHIGQCYPYSGRRSRAMKRFPLVLTVALVMVLAVAVGASAGHRATTTLRFSVQQGSSDAVFQALVNNFQK